MTDTLQARLRATLPRVGREAADRIDALEAALRELDDAIFNDPQVIERAGTLRAIIQGALAPAGGAEGRREG